jgi:hypothetical protein
MLEQIWRGHGNREPARTSETVPRGDGNLLGYQKGYVKVRISQRISRAYSRTFKDSS